MDHRSLGAPRAALPAPPRLWGAVLLLAGVTALSTTLLVGYSVWFLGTVSLAGLASVGAAYTFNFHVPAALIRLLALTRVVAGLGERLLGHRLALDAQAQHRTHHFRAAAQAHALKQQNWQLARGDALHSFMASIEAVEFRVLRVRIPALVLAGLAGLLLITAAVFSLLAASLIALVLALVAGLTHRAYQRVYGRAAAFNAAVRDSAAYLAGMAFSSRSLKGSSLLQTHIEAWSGQEQAAETARAAIQTAAKTLELAIWTLGIGLAALLISLPLTAAPVLGAFLGFWSLAIFAAFAQMPAQVLAAASARLATQDLTCPAPTLTAPTPSLDLAAVIDASRQGSVCLIGPSGSGKTLALKALATRLQSTGQRVGLALHDAAVLAASWRTNLDPLGQATTAKLLNALQIVGLKDVCEARGGLDAFLSGQSALSTGQAHRLGLARVLVGAYDVALIDEIGEHLSAPHRHSLSVHILADMADKPLVFTTHDRAVADLASTVFEVKTP